MRGRGVATGSMAPVTVTMKGDVPLRSYLITCVCFAAWVADGAEDGGVAVGCWKREAIMKLLLMLALLEQ